MTDGHLDRIDEEEEDGEEAGNTAAAMETETAPENGGNNVSEPVKIKNPIENAAVLKTFAPAKITNPECVICTGYILRGLKSVQPCPCGYYVHNSCLMVSLQMYEAEHPGCAPLGCKYCKTLFNITPRKSLAVRVLEKSYSFYGRLCDVSCHMITVVLVDTTFTLAGICLLYKLYGHNEAEDILSSMDPVLVVSICKAIPLISIGINFIPWEVKLLRLLRRYNSRSSPATPVPLGSSAEVYNLFPQSTAHSPVQAHVREVKYRRTLLGALLGGLLLPWYAFEVGDKVFWAVPSPVLRLVLGGLTFVVVKGGLMMYYRQRLYARMCYLRVAPYRGD